MKEESSPHYTVEYFHRVYCLMRVECAQYSQVKDIFEAAHSESLSHDKEEHLPTQLIKNQDKSSSLRADPYAQAYSALIFATGASFFVDAKANQFQVKLKESPRLASLCAEKANKFLTVECSTSSSNAQYARCLLGMFFYLGLGVERNYEIAVSWFEEAARSSNDLALYMLSICYASGYGVTKDDLMSFEYCHKAAENGFVEAQRRMGLYYQNQLDESTLANGFGQEMIRWFQAAAEQGFAKAQYDLANCYRKIATRQGVFGNFSDESLERCAAKNCVSWYKSASERGHLYALNNLAACYLNGVGTPVRIKQGMILLQQAADRNCPEAMYELGKRFASGDGVPRNKPQAEQLLRAAATNHNHKESQYALAELLNSSRESNASRFINAEAIALYTAAANSNHIESMIKLAEIYFNGHGVEKDRRLGAMWYQRAAESGHVLAQYQLGCCYLFGDGMDIDYSQSFKWLANAASNGHLESFLMIGQCYDVGMGVEKDESKAACWFKKAARAGSSEAQYKIGCYYFDGIGLPIDKCKAIDYFIRAATQGHSQALELLQR